MADDNSKNNKRKKKIGMIRFEIVKKELKKTNKSDCF